VIEYMVFQSPNLPITEGTLYSVHWLSTRHPGLESRYAQPKSVLCSHVIYCSISIKCSATVTRDGKCSVFLSSDLSRMCDMDKKCSVQHKFIRFG